MVVHAEKLATELDRGLEVHRKAVEETPEGWRRTLAKHKLQEAESSLRQTQGEASTLREAYHLAIDAARMEEKAS